MSVRGYEIAQERRREKQEQRRQEAESEYTLRLERAKEWMRQHFLQLMVGVHQHLRTEGSLTGAEGENPYGSFMGLDTTKDAILVHIETQGDNRPLYTVSWSYSEDLLPTVQQSHQWLREDLQSFGRSPHATFLPRWATDELQSLEVLL